jgi:hypothetical protein
MHIADFIANAHRFQARPWSMHLGCLACAIALLACSCQRLKTAYTDEVSVHLQNEAILLIHFSSRYKRSEIVGHLNTWLPPALKAKCVPLLNGYAD